MASGVVTDEIPRYMVIGEAANMAAKMESHGMPDKIQITEGVFK